MEDNANKVIVNFKADTESSVSIETANSLMRIVEASSLEIFIQHSLATFRKSLEIAYTPKEGLTTSEHWAVIARVHLHGMQFNTKQFTW
jgi:hypothetical protein